MPFQVLLMKCWRESRWLLLACCVGIFGFCWLRVYLISRLDTSSFQTILELLPSDWLKFAPVEFSWLVTYAGRISLAYSEPLVLISMTIWAIARGSDAVSGELSRGTLEMLLCQPIRRIELLGANMATTVFGCLIIAAAAWGGTWVGIQQSVVREEVAVTWKLPVFVPGIGGELPLPWAEKQTREVPMREKVRSRWFAPASGLLASIGICAAALATMISAIDRYRWRTIGITVGIALVQWMAKVAAIAAEEFRWLRFFTVLTLYEPEVVTQVAVRDPEQLWALAVWDSHRQLAGAGAAGAILVLLGLAAVMYGVAAVSLARRDLPAPL